MNVTETFKDGKQRIEIKRKYAYHYNIRTGSLIGRTEIEDEATRKHFKELLDGCGFKIVDDPSS